MLVLEIILIILLIVGIVYIATILFYAKKVQHQEYYHADKYLEEWDFWNVEGMNLNFLEGATEALKKNGFRWVDDYKLQEKDGNCLRLSKHQNTVVECYSRYFVHEIENTVGKIDFYKAYGHDIEGNDLGNTACLHYLSVETALKDKKHLKSGIIYEPTGDVRVFEELLECPGDECRFYRDEGDIEELITEHLSWLNAYKREDAIDHMVALRPLPEVVNAWWNRAYAVRKDMYYYKEDKACYGLTFTYCIKVVLCYPFFKLSKYI